MHREIINNIKRPTVNHRNINTVIFDFDGTLAELNINFDLMRQSIDQLIDSFGIDVKRLKNSLILEKVQEVEALLETTLPGNARSFRVEAYRIIETIEVGAAANGRLFRRTKELLSSLTQLHIQTGIITRNCARAVYTVFPDLPKFCHVCICRGHVNNRVKPDPYQLNYALLSMKASHHDTIMIGDHPLDIKTGKNAGTLTAGVTTGHFKEKHFIEVGADFILHEAADILTYL